MTTEQKTLFNTCSMSSAKSIARLARERAVASYRSNLPTVAKSIARPAVVLAGGSKPLPERSQEKSTPPEKKTSKSESSEKDEAVSEFHLPDESRNFALNFLPHCPACRLSSPQMQKRVETDHSHRFRLVCSTTAYKLTTPGNQQWQKILKEQCLTYSTPWFATSRQAIAHWKMVALLSKI